MQFLKPIINSKIHTLYEYFITTFHPPPYDHIIYYLSTPSATNRVHFNNKCVFFDHFCVYTKTDRAASTPITTTYYIIILYIHEVHNCCTRLGVYLAHVMWSPPRNIPIRRVTPHPSPVCGVRNSGSEYLMCASSSI